MPGLYSATDEERANAEKEVADGLAAEGESPVTPPPAEPPAQHDVSPETSRELDAAIRDSSEQPDFSGVQPPEPIRGAGTFEAAEEGLNQARESAYRVAGAQSKLGDIKADRATADAGVHDTIADEQKRQAEELAAQDRAQQEGLARAHQIAEDSQKQYKDFKFTNWWARQDTGTKVLANISIFLGGFVSGVKGGDNKALAQINRVIDNDFRQQQQELGQLKTFAEWKRQGEQDLASKYRTESAKLLVKQSRATAAAAEEAKAELLRNGADEATATNNVVVRGLLAKADSDMANGLEQLAKDQAMIAMAGARLQNSTDAANDRKIENKNKREDKEDNTTVRAEENDPSGLPAGSVIGHVPTGKGGAQGFATRDADYGRGKEQLEALLNDIDKYGSRVKSAEAIKRRNTLYHNAVIGVATVSPLGKTNEAMEAEAGSLGPSGSPDITDLHSVVSSIGSVATGANRDAVARKIKELEDQRARYRRQTLIPVKPGSRDDVTKEEPTLTRKPAPGKRQVSKQAESLLDKIEGK